MDGHEQFCFKIKGSQYGFFRHHVNIGPPFIILTAFQYRDVKGAVFIANSFEM
jgi:hypothetical protein